MKATICLMCTFLAILCPLVQDGIYAQTPLDPEPKKPRQPSIPSAGERVQRILTNPNYGIPDSVRVLIKPNENDDPTRKLQREQLIEAIECVGFLKFKFDNGSGDSSGLLLNDLHKYQRLAVVAAFDLAETNKQKTECLEFLVDAAKVIERIEVERSIVTGSSVFGASAAKYWRLDAEINLLKFKRDSVPPKAP